MDPTDYPPPPSVPEPPAPTMPPVSPPPPTDFTPPPPSAPEVPVTPPAAPEVPQYAPPPPPENMPPSYAAQAAPPPQKKSKVLVIVLVILGVLLLCCAGGIVGALTIFKADSDVTTDTSVDFDFDTETEAPDDATGELETPAEETGGRAEWVEFQPELADASIYAEPTAKQTALIEEIHAKLYPGFKIEDTIAEPGIEDADSYYPDMLYVKASLESDPDVRIAYYMWTDSEASTAGGVHLTEEQAESYETLAQSSSGTYYIYDHENLIGLMEGSIDDRITGVLAQAEAEFPGYVAIIVGEDGDNIGAVLTRWSAFPDLEDGLAVTFEPDGDGWAVADITDW